MRIAVCVKQVVTRETHVRVNADGSWIRDEAASWGLNEPDAYALEAALQLNERYGGEVIAVSAGPARVAQVLRESLARGADRAIHVDGDHLAAADASVTAMALASALASEAVDLVLTGLQSDDQGFGQVGVLLAERLSMAHSTIIMNIEVVDGHLRVKRELEGGWFQWITLPLPAVLTVQSGIDQLRTPRSKASWPPRRRSCASCPRRRRGRQPPDRVGLTCRTGPRRRGSSAGRRPTPRQRS